MTWRALLTKCIGYYMNWNISEIVPCAKAKECYNQHHFINFLWPFSTTCTSFAWRLNESGICLLMTARGNILCRGIANHLLFLSAHNKFSVITDRPINCCYKLVCTIAKKFLFVVKTLEDKLHQGHQFWASHSFKLLVQKDSKVLPSGCLAITGGKHMQYQAL